MTEDLLAALGTEDFEDRHFGIATVEALRSLLACSPEVRAIRDGLWQEAIREEDLEQFVSRLIGELRPGTQFNGDLQLAALAVTLERRATAFSEAFLQDLAGLKLAEMVLAPRVARLCLAERRNQAKNRSKIFQLEEQIVTIALGSVRATYSAQEARESSIQSQTLVIRGAEGLMCLS